MFTSVRLSRTWLIIYTQLVRPVLEYVAAAWESASDTAFIRLETFQKRAARLTCGIRWKESKTSVTSLPQKLDLKSLSERWRDRRLKVFSKYHHSSKTAINNYARRTGFSSGRKLAWQYFIPHTNTLHYQRLFFIRTAKDWNALPVDSPHLIPPSA